MHRSSQPKSISLLKHSKRYLRKHWKRISSPCSKCGEYNSPIGVRKNGDDYRFLYFCRECNEKYTRSLNSMISFRKLCSRASIKHAKGLFSSTERRIIKALRKQGVPDDEWKHNVKRKCVYNGRARYYEIDIFFPRIKVGLEGDGSVWHELWGVPDKDLLRDKLLWEQHGIEILRTSSKDKDEKLLDQIAYIKDRFVHCDWIEEEASRLNYSIEDQVSI